MFLFVGDIGGTHTRLALAELHGDEVNLVTEKVYSSRAHRELGEILKGFLKQVEDIDVAWGCLGVAGPVLNNRCQTTNLPWLLDGDDLADDAGLAGLSLINDLEAAAWGIELLSEDSYITLHAGEPQARGNQAVIAAGTGLGEAGRLWCAGGYRPFASEGSHGDFAPRDELGFSLKKWLARKYDGHVSWERIVSGPALVDLHAFLREESGQETPDWLVTAMTESDPAGAIASAAQLKEEPVACQALDMLICYFGAEAGNHALKLMATGGVYLTGGIAPKISSRFSAAGFLDAFFDKGRMRPLMERIPVHLVTDGNLALYGAARCASQIGAQ